MIVRSTIMYATRLQEPDGECLAGFMHDEYIAKICFYKPVERFVVRDLCDGEASEYWAWWDARKQRFECVFPHRSGVAICFPYGPEVETQRGNGEVVNVMVEKAT